MDDFLRRQPPSSLDAEQSVIGSMLIDPTCVADVVSKIKPDDFYYSQNRTVFETFLAMFGTGETIDAVTVLERLRADGLAEGIGGRDYLMQLMEITPTSAHVQEYLNIVKDKAMLRHVGEVASHITEMVESGEGSAQNVLENAERMIYELRQGKESSDLYSIRTVLYNVMANLDELARNKGQLPGIPTGLRDLDNFISGLNKSDLILVAARPGMGKTSFALNIAENAARSSGKAVVIFQLEMSREQVVTRMLSSVGSIDSQKLRTGNMDEADFGRLAMAASALAQLDLYIDDNSSITVPEMKSKCRRFGDRLGLVVIDYLQLMHSAQHIENRVNEVAELSRSLKIMAKELNVPVVCLSQLSRATEQRADKKPILSDLRESGSIEQDADIVLFLYRDDYYNRTDKDSNEAELSIAKNRHGATGTVTLQWQGQFTRFGATTQREAPGS